MRPLADIFLVQGYPIKVRFGGFESDTYQLQRAGWQLSISEQPDHYRPDEMVVTLSAKHEGLRLYLLSFPFRFNRFERMHKVAHEPGQWEQNLKYYCFELRAVAREIFIETYGGVEFPRFSAIDAEPQYIPIKLSERKNLEDIALFQPLNKDVEIFVPEHSVAELMEIILSKQEPQQKELREKRRKEFLRADVRAEIGINEGYNPSKDIKAQLVCVSGR